MSVNTAYMTSRNLYIDVYDPYVEGESRHVRPHRQVCLSACIWIADSHACVWTACARQGAGGRAGWRARGGGARQRSSHTCMAVRCPDACGQTDLSMRTDMVASLTDLPGCQVGSFARLAVSPGWLSCQVGCLARLAVSPAWLSRQVGC